jgi:spore germination cell wall hydrolase CwlJ-like protein
VLNLEKALNLTLAHLKAAITAVARWWDAMSGAERRQTRQRVVVIAASAFAFMAGGPVIGQRFEAQKSEEAYRADAIVLAQSLGSGGPAAVQHVSFSGKANPTALFQSVSFTLEQPSDAGLAALPLRERDTMAIKGLADFTAENLGFAAHEQAELDCLAEAVYYEARSESAKGQMAVAEVVLNRVRDPNFPKTVCGVVFQGRYRTTGCQFTFTCDGSLRVKPRGEAWDRARAVALHVSMGLSKPITNKATHYHTDYVNPYWSPGLVETATIGTHIFYRFPKTGAEWNKARLALAAQNGDDDRLTMPVPVEDGVPVATPVSAPANDADSLAAAALVKITVQQAELPPIVPASSTEDARVAL